MKKKLMFLTLIVSIIFLIVLINANNSQKCVEDSLTKICETSNGMKSLEVFSPRYYDKGGLFGINAGWKTPNMNLEKLNSKGVDYKIEKAHYKVYIKNGLPNQMQFIKDNDIYNLEFNGTFKEVNNNNIIYDISDKTFNATLTYTFKKEKIDKLITIYNITNKITENFSLKENYNYFNNENIFNIDEDIIYWDKKDNHKKKYKEKVKKYDDKTFITFDKDLINNATFPLYIDPSLNVTSNINLGGTHTYDWIIVNSGATITLNETYLELNAKQYIYVYGTINGNEKVSTSNAGVGIYEEVTQYWAGTGGGGGGSSNSGGKGRDAGYSQYTSGGSGGGSIINNTDFNDLTTGRSGRKGGYGTGGGGGNAGIGGGTIKLKAPFINITGVLNVNGGNGGNGGPNPTWHANGGSGGGSGGSIILVGNNVSIKSSTLNAVGGSGGYGLTDGGCSSGDYLYGTGGGGGSGGSIKIAFNNTFFNSTYTKNIGGGSGGASDVACNALNPGNGNNGGGGSFYVEQRIFNNTFTPLITLNSPINNTLYNTTNKITFNSTISSDNNLINVSLYINGILNLTNSTPDSNTNFLFTQTFLNNTYLWNIEACNINGCNFADNNWSINVTYFETFTSVLNSPTNNTNSSNLTQIFNVTGTSTINSLTNATLNIWNSSDALIYNNTKSITGLTNTTTFNYTFTNYDTYKWNVKYYDNQSNYKSATSNNTLKIYNDSLILTSTSEPTSISFINDFNISTTVSHSSDTTMKECNFTVTDPDSNILINNKNGTVSGNVWKTQTLNANKTGVYTYNTTCFNTYGDNATSSGSFNVTYHFAYAPNNYLFSAQNNRTETKTVPISAYDDSSSNIIYSLSAAIDQPGNFTLSLSQNSITLNSTDSVSLPSLATLTLNASSAIGNGTYNGNITFTNSTYGLTYVGNFTYAITPPGGNPEIFIGSTSCSDLKSTTCSKIIEDVIIDNSRSQTYTIENTGLYNMSQCYGKIEYRSDGSNNLNSSGYVSFSDSNFALDIGVPKNLTMTLSPTSGADVNIRYHGYLFVSCLEGDLGGNIVETATDNRPFIELDVDPLLPGGGASGGGGGTTIIQGESTTQWSMTTTQGTGSYDLKMIQDTSRTKGLIFKNVGVTSRTITLRCEESASGTPNLCKYIEFEKKIFDLPLGQDIETNVDFTLTLPKDVRKGKYISNIAAFDEAGNKAIVTVNTDVETFGLLVGLGPKVLSSKNLFGIHFPIFLLWLIIMLTTWITSYFAGLRKLPKGGGGISFGVGIITATLVVLFI